MCARRVKNLTFCQFQQLLQPAVLICFTANLWLYLWCTIGDSRWHVRVSLYLCRWIIKDRESPQSPPPPPHSLGYRPTEGLTHLKVAALPRDTTPNATGHRCLNEKHRRQCHACLLNNQIRRFSPKEGFVCGCDESNWVFHLNKFSVSYTLLHCPWIYFINIFMNISSPAIFMSTRYNYISNHSPLLLFSSSQSTLSLIIFCHVSGFPVCEASTCPTTISASSPPPSVTSPPWRRSTSAVTTWPLCPAPWELCPSK